MKKMSFKVLMEDHASNESVREDDQLIKKKEDVDDVSPSAQAMMMMMMTMMMMMMVMMTMKYITLCTGQSSHSWPSAR